MNNDTPDDARPHPKAPTTRRMVLLTTGIVLILVVGSLVVGSRWNHQEEGFHPTVAKEIRTLSELKKTFTATQRKMDPSLIEEMLIRRKEWPFNGDLFRQYRSGVKVQPDGRVRVKIEGEITEELLQLIADCGGTVADLSAGTGAIFADVPLLELEHVAESDDVKLLTNKFPIIISWGPVKANI